MPGDQKRKQHAVLRTERRDRVSRTGDGMRLVPPVNPLFDMRIRILSDIALKPWPVLAEIVPQPGQPSPIESLERPGEFRGKARYGTQMIGQQMRRF
jgi:hypothetical protein